MVIFFTDSRFRSLFKKLYRWDKVLGHYQLGRDLAVETTTVATYPARSRLECVVVCQSCGNCTAVDYGTGEQLCHCVTHVFAILPWCWGVFFQVSFLKIYSMTHMSFVPYGNLTKHMQIWIRRTITEVESVCLFRFLVVAQIVMDLDIFSQNIMKSTEWQINVPLVSKPWPNHNVFGVPITLSFVKLHRFYRSGRWNNFSLLSSFSYWNACKNHNNELSVTHLRSH